MNAPDGLDFHPTSWGDPAGRLFWDEGRLYRGIRAARADFYRDLLTRGVIQALVDQRLLIETMVSGKSYGEFPLVVEHRAIPTVSFAAEWCASQLKAAALQVLNLEVELRGRGLTLVDVNPWNVVFDATHPYLVDLGCITSLPDRDQWIARRQFHEFYVNPLLVFQKGLPRIARRLLFDPWNGVSDAEVQAVCAPAPRPLAPRSYDVAGATRHGLKSIARTVVPARLRPVLRAAVRSRASTPAAPVTTPVEAMPEIVALRDRVAALDVLGTRTAWAGFYVQNFPPFTPGDAWTAKHHSVERTLLNERPRTLLDIGANRGWYSQLAAHRGVAVIAADSDETSLNELYSDASDAGLAIHPVFMDVRFPEPAQGPGYRLIPPATERFKSEMVLALALVHHLVFTFQLSFAQIAETLAMFSTRSLVVEFVGPGDDYVRTLDPGRYPWYRLDAFLDALHPYFEFVERLPSDNGGLDNRGHERSILFLRRR